MADRGSETLQGKKGLSRFVSVNAAPAPPQPSRRALMAI